MDAGRSKSSSESNYVAQNQMEQERRVRRAEKEANKRIQKAHQNAEDQEKVYRQRLDYVKDEYQHQSLKESARQEEAFEKQRSKGYENLRNVRREQNKELSRAIKEGEKTLQETEVFYRDKTLQTEQDGEKKIRDLVAQNAKRDQFERTRQKDNNAIATAMGRYQIQETRDEYNKKAKMLRADSERKHQKLVEDHLTHRETAKGHYQDQLATLIQHQDQTLQNLYKKTSEDLFKLQSEYSRKLSAYSTRQDDPFYQHLDLQAELNESDDEYVVRAQIPTHEQEHIQVNINGNELEISGKRRNQETQELPSGVVRTTSSYQSYSERFPLVMPVNENLLSKSFSGDELTVRVPKKGGVPPRETFQRKQEVISQRPKFPENIPDLEAEFAKNSSTPRKPLVG